MSDLASPTDPGEPLGPDKVERATQPTRPASQVLAGRLAPLMLRFPLIAGSIFVVLALVVSLLSGIRLLPLAVVMAGTVSIHIAGAALLRRDLWPSMVNLILRLANLTAYTLAIMLSDSLYSPLIPLYAEDILSASVRDGRHGAWKGWGLVTVALVAVALATSPLGAAELARFMTYAVVMGIIAMIAGEVGQQRIEVHSALAQQTLENARLYAELEERAQCLNEAYKELKELDRRKTELAQSVSHELRTPLLFIRGYIELMLEGGLGELSELQQEKLQIVAGKTRQLVTLVRDVLLLQTGKPHREEMKKISLAQLARRAVNSAEAMGRELGIAFSIDIPTNALNVWGDARRLEEVFDNLLSNAIKFSRDGGTIIVRARRDDGFVVVSVADEGIGIPPDEHERIFERFYQVDSTVAQRFGGTGLGLAIVKEIVKGHDGQVWVQSPTLPGDTERGSTFYFSVPVAKRKT